MKRIRILVIVLIITLMASSASFAASMTYYYVQTTFDSEYNVLSYIYAEDTSRPRSLQETRRFSDSERTSLLGSPDLNSAVGVNRNFTTANDKVFPLTFPGTLNGAVSGADYYGMASRVQTELCGSLSDIIHFVYPDGFSSYSDAGSSLNAMFDAMDGRYTLFAGDRSYSFSGAYSEGSRRYILGTEHGSRERKTFCVGLYDETEDRWITARAIAYEALGNVSAAGDTFIDGSNFAQGEDNAGFSLLTTILRGLIMAIKAPFQLWNTNDLVFNQGLREYYVQGVFPAGWEVYIWSVYVVSEVIAAVILLYSIIMSTTKRALSTTNMMGRRQAWVRVQNFIIAGVLLSLLPVLMQTLMLFSKQLTAMFFAPVTDKVAAGGLTNKYGTGTLAGILVELLYFGIDLYFNFAYVLRAFTVAILIILSPLAIAAITMDDAKKSITVMWWRTLLGNIFIQPIHAFLFMLLLLFPVPGRVFEKIIMVYATIPLSNLIKRILIPNADDAVDNAATHASRRATAAAAGAGTAALGATLAGVHGITENIGEKVHEAFTRREDTTMKESASGSALGSGSIPSEVSAEPSLQNDPAVISAAGLNLPGYEESAGLEVGSVSFAASGTPASAGIYSAAMPKGSGHAEGVALEGSTNASIQPINGISEQPSAVQDYGLEPEGPYMPEDGSLSVPKEDSVREEALETAEPELTIPEGGTVSAETKEGEIKEQLVSTFSEESKDTVFTENSSDMPESVAVSSEELSQKDGSEDIKPAARPSVQSEGENQRDPEKIQNAARSAWNLASGAALFAGGVALAGAAGAMRVSPKTGTEIARSAFSPSRRSWIRPKEAALKKPLGSLSYKADSSMGNLLSQIDRDAVNSGDKDAYLDSFGIKSLDKVSDEKGKISYELAASDAFYDAYVPKNREIGYDASRGKFVHEEDGMTKRFDTYEAAVNGTMDQKRALSSYYADRSAAYGISIPDESSENDSSFSGAAVAGAPLQEDRQNEKSSFIKGAEADGPTGQTLQTIKERFDADDSLRYEDYGISEEGITVDENGRYSVDFSDPSRSSDILFPEMKDVKKDKETGQFKNQGNSGFDVKGSTFSEALDGSLIDTDMDERIQKFFEGQK